MKKIVVFIVMVLLVGCNQKEVELDLIKLYSGIESLNYKDSNNQIRPLFNNEIIDNEKLQSKYDLDISNIDKILFSIPKEMDQASMYIIVLPKENKKDEVNNEIENFFIKYEQEWALYFPKEEALIKNRLQTSYGQYLIYIVSNDNNKVLNYIKENN